MTTIHTQLLSFTTMDDETLHGLLFTPADELSDLALLFVHGVAMNFYLPPLAVFGQAIAERGYHGFVINTRGHDWINRAGNLTASAVPPMKLSKTARWTSMERWSA
jgi:predicted alpha/beta-fold hydrolase